MQTRDGLTSVQHERKFIVVGRVMLESMSAAGPGGGRQNVLDTAARWALNKCAA